MTLIGVSFIFTVCSGVKATLFAKNETHVFQYASNFPGPHWTMAGGIAVFHNLGGARQATKEVNARVRVKCEKYMAIRAVNQRLEVRVE